MRHSERSEPGWKNPGDASIPDAVASFSQYPPPRPTTDNWGLTTDHPFARASKRPLHWHVVCFCWFCAVFPRAIWSAVSTYSTF